MVGTSGLESCHARAQLTAHPRHLPLLADPPTGDLTLAGTRTYVPVAYAPEHPAALLVMLHGAGGNPDHALALARPIADHFNAIIVAPKSTHNTWDILRPGFGPDVATIDRTLSAVFDSYAIDPDRIAIGGFSDGASYALSLGISNGTLFRTILAFSPGFSAPRDNPGHPRIFISHGTLDRILPIRCARQVSRECRDLGLDVDYVEFEGTHTIPSTILARGFERWLLPTAGTP
jgi:predicted esterase